MSMFAFCVLSAATADRFPPCATVGGASIDMLPDNVLLEIFHFYRDQDELFFRIDDTWRWKALTQVCRQWRYVILGSPRRLDLQVVCTSMTPTSRLLDIWPPFPIIVSVPSWFPEVDEDGAENLIAALECRDRTSVIQMYNIRGPVLENLISVLHEPLPVLTHFSLESADESVPALPETFLGGSAPHLESFRLKGIPFPSFPKFIRSSTHIVALHLLDIPLLRSYYVSPEVMARCLTALPNLECLSIGFRPPRSYLLLLLPPDFPRAVLPALRFLSFSGSSQFFEDFVDRIDTPCLTELNIAFFPQSIFDIPLLRNFIHHTEGFRSFDEAAIEFSDRSVKIVFGSPLIIEGPPRFELEIGFKGLDWQLSSMTQIFGQQLPLLSLVEQLKICQSPSGLDWEDDPYIASWRWLELFRLCVAAQSLHVSEELVSPVAKALQDLMGQRDTEVLPVLRALFLEGLQPSGPVHEAMESFTTTRQLSNQPVVIQRWEREPRP